jgi:hypothetical protein
MRGGKMVDEGTDEDAVIVPLPQQPRFRREEQHAG